MHTNTHTCALAAHLAALPPRGPAQGAASESPPPMPRAVAAGNAALLARCSMQVGAGRPRRVAQAARAGQGQLLLPMAGDGGEVAGMGKRSGQGPGAADGLGTGRRAGEAG